MTNPLRVALCGLLFLAGPAFAQEAEDAPDAAVPGAPSPETPAPDAPTLAVAPVAADAVAFPVGAPYSAQSQERLWARVDVLAAWVHGMHLPPLATTAPVGTPITNAGALGNSATQVLIGDGDVNGKERTGVQFVLGGWFDDDQFWGVEAGYSILEALGTSFSAQSDGTTILTRPFTDAATGTSTSFALAFPGTASGSIAVSATSSHFQGAYVDFSERITANPAFRLDTILGYRFLRLDERLEINDTIVPAGGAFVAGTVITNTDRFATQNEFHGGEVGLKGTFFFDRLSLEVLGKIAVGNLHREVAIDGRTRFNVPGANPTDVPAGILALASNSGTFITNDWVAAPEVGLHVALDVTSNLKLRLGYSYLLFTEVARPGDQIDLTVNQTLLPGGAATGVNRPNSDLHRSDVGVQSVNAGLVFSY